MKKIVLLDKIYCGFESVSDLERDVSEMWNDATDVPAEFQGTIKVLITYEEDEKVTDEAKAMKLLEMVRDFIKKHEILSDESAFQSDSVQIASCDFVCDMLNVVDEYVKLDDEE